MMVPEEDAGYQLATELEASSMWRPWLGDQLYSELRLHLASSSAWFAFMKSDAATNPTRLRLQLKVRALLYDKALDFPRPTSSTIYWQLHPDSVYFSLEHDASDWSRLQTERAPSMAILLAKYGLDSRDMMLSHQLMSSELKKKAAHQRKIAASAPKQGRSGVAFRGVDHPKPFGRMTSANVDCDKILDCDLWYDQWFDKHLSERMHRLAKRLSQQKVTFSEQDALRRTPEGMAAFISLTARARERHQHGDAKLEKELETPIFEADLAILPELTSISNSVPENPCPANSRHPQGIEMALDGETSLLGGLSRQSLKRRNAARKNRLSSEEAELITRQTIAKILESHGFEGVKQIAMDILSEVMVSHIRKLGSWLRLLLDSYQRHLSTDELLRMFMLKAACHPARENHPESLGSLRSLAEYVKNERIRGSQIPPTESNSHQFQQYHQSQSRQLAAFQQSMYLKKKQLPSLRTNKNVREDVTAAVEMKPYVSTLNKQPWISQPVTSSSHAQVLQHLKQQLPALHLSQTMAKVPAGPSFQDILSSDIMKQETADDFEMTLGSPNKRKRKEY